MGVFFTHSNRKNLLVSILVILFLLGFFSFLYLKENKAVSSTAPKGRNYVNEVYKLWEDVEMNRETNKNSYGEMGLPLPKEFLTTNKDEISASYKDYGFNQFGSDSISLHRSIPDQRPFTCKNLKYRSQLPNVSVIIVFYDEGHSTLFRTVHSVLDRSPTELIHEIILVDDGSTMEHLKQPLEEYVKRFKGKVKIARAPQHDGLITAKNFGAQKATGEVLLFLDSHCEVSVGWLPPLLSPIAENYKVVTVPMIDVIDHNTFEYSTNKGLSIGTFSWTKFYYKEKSISGSELHKNIESPVMAGGLFAISKKWWDEFGAYDPELFIWGGEQYEISFKIWMCGGKMLNIPCSHVGHIYRGPGKISVSDINQRHPNSFNINHKRVAEVWMDEYKNFLYMQDHNIKDAAISSTINDRIKIRENLKCKSFEWYLRNVINDTLYTRYEPDFALSAVMSPSSQNCICSNGFNQPLKYELCSMCYSFYKIWRYTWIGEFKEDEHCWDYDHPSGLIYNRFCHEQRGSQYFKFENSFIKNPQNNKCVAANNTTKTLTLQSCSLKDPNYNMLWHIKMNNLDSPPNWANKALHPPREH